jgi:hypothetical protein
MEWFGGTAGTVTTTVTHSSQFCFNVWGAYILAQTCSGGTDSAVSP